MGELPRPCWDDSSQDFELEVLAGDDAEGAEIHLDGLAGQFGVVVLLAEVAEPYISQVGVEAFGQYLCCLMVAQMACAAHDAVLQYLRVLTAPEHLFVVVGLEHEVVRLEDVMLHALSGHSHVGHDGERLVAVADAESYVLRRVMGDGERGDAEAGQFELRVLLYDMCLVRVDRLGYMEVAVDAFVYEFGGIYGDVVILADLTCRFDVIGMVVGDDNSLDVTETQPVFLHVALHSANTDTRIDEDCSFAVAEIVAIAATTTSESQKRQHLITK